MVTYVLIILLGGRPNRFPHFDDDTWDIMELCWHGNPKYRPHMGQVEEMLVALRKKYDKRDSPRKLFGINIFQFKICFVPQSGKGAAQPLSSSEFEIPSSEF